MRPPSLQGARLSLMTMLLCACAFLSAANAQQTHPPTPPAQETDDVIKINTELRQTDVMVFDRQGRFVDGLKPEQFELRVDGKPVQVSFFERVTAGSINEEAQIAAARGGATLSAATDAGVKPLDRGRTFFFFVDDMHQTFESLKLTKQLLLDFIEKEMGQNDAATIASTTGQIGFLQQLTDNKAVLRAAVARLTLGPQLGSDNQRPYMSESMALAIERNDNRVIDYFVDALAQDGMPRDTAENLVRGRAQQILQQSLSFTIRTLAALESLTRYSAGYTGRKIIFFLSDGFILNNAETQTADRMRNITNAAARNQIVIYSLNAHGLTGGGDNYNASKEGSFDPTGRLSAYTSGDETLIQEPLRTLAGNTGGRALINTNKPGAEIPRALAETSIYYLLAWRPQSQEQRGNKFRRIEVKVTGRPELTVQVRGGYYDINAQQSAKAGKAEVRPASSKTPDDELREALRAPSPRKALPLQLSLTYIDIPTKGLLLSAATQIDSRSIDYVQAENKSTGAVEIVGVVYTDQGKPAASFKDHLDIVSTSAEHADAPRPPIIYNFPSYVGPGLYQVRIAVRDSKSGRTGSAAQWIEIPDLSSRKLSLSSLLIGEITKESEGLQIDPAAFAKSRLSVDHHFGRSSRLRFLTFIYNAARGEGGAGSPDIALQIQVLRDDQPVVTAPLRKVQEGDITDHARIAYAAEIPLEAMPPGRYVLQVTAIDRIAKTSASQRTNFEID